MNLIPQFIARWIWPDGQPGQGMPDDNYDELVHWTKGMNKSQPETKHWVEEWKQEEKKR